MPFAIALKKCVVPYVNGDSIRTLFVDTEFMSDVLRQFEKDGPHLLVVLQIFDGSNSVSHTLNRRNKVGVHNTGSVITVCILPKGNSVFTEPSIQKVRIGLS